MLFIHYTDKPLTFRKDFIYQQPTSKYNQDDFFWNNKPEGFWFAMESKYLQPRSWKKFCKDLGWDRWLQYSYEINCDKNANYIIIDSLESIIIFSIKYIDRSHKHILLDFSLEDIEIPFRKNERYFKLREAIGINRINWNAVVKDYQGILVFPYPISHVSPSPDADFCPLWYYRLDVPSGCIWDLDSIDDIKLINYEKYKSNKQNGEFYVR